MTGSEIIAAEMTAGAPRLTKIDDEETRRAVNLQYTIEKYARLFLIFITAIQVVYQLKEQGVLSAIILIPFAFLYYWLLSKIVRVAILKPMRAWRYGACTKRMLRLAHRQIDYTEVSAWRYPMPRVIAINPRASAVFIQGPSTDYYGLTLAPRQILEVKVEREQTIETSTHHSARSIYNFGSSSFGILGGGESWSSSSVVESAYLEIAYNDESGGMPRRAIFPFHDRRREADDWALAINQIRDRTP